MLNIFENVLAVMASVGAAVGFRFLLQRVWPSELRRQHNDLIGWHLSVLGTTYAVMMGFMLYAVWGNFETAQANADAEASSLVNMVRSSRGLAAAPREQILKLAGDYVSVILTKEWPAMGRVNSAQHRALLFGNYGQR